jgi:polyisoprenyl-phosphate glycosyltransferase
LFESEEEVKDCTVVMPCYKEKKEVVEKLYHDLVKEGFEVIVVDDGMTMPELTIPTLFYTPHQGYGYALKTGIKAASTPIVMTLDGDGQHSVEDAVKMYTVFKLINNCDMLVGCRWNLNEKPIRWIARKMINFTASLWAKNYMIDLNSGMRIFRRDSMIGYFPILCDTFSFTTSLAMAMVTDNKKIAWFPIDVLPRANGKSHVRLFRDGIITLKYIFWIGFALRTRRIRQWLRSIVS